MKRLIVSGLLAGAVLNICGWLGNNLLLEPMWEAATARMRTVEGYTRGIENELLGFLPDFVYGLALAWLYSSLVPRYGEGTDTALRAAFAVWLVGAATTYLASANYGLIPFGVSVATTALAAATFVPAGWVVAHTATE